MQPLADEAAPARARVEHALGLDAHREVERIASFLRRALGGPLARRGLVVAISGGVDSAVSAALAVEAVGPGRVFGLLLPEHETHSESTRLGAEVARMLGIGFETVAIGPVLEAIGCYAERDAAVRALLPGYGPGWRMKIVLAEPLGSGFPRFRLVAEDPKGARFEQLLDRAAYLAIVAATNHKQRIRKTVEYHHADRLHYAVVGTPNRLEYELGFFVRNGDGSADVKPIAHLLKTQVYALAEHFRLPEAVRSATPTTDTYSLPQGQDEFYFALPHDRMDRALAALDLGLDDGELAAAVGLPQSRVPALRRSIEAQRAVARQLARAPLLVTDPLP